MVNKILYRNYRLSNNKNKLTKLDGEFRGPGAVISLLMARI
jgi:hypothetical protein